MFIFEMYYFLCSFSFISLTDAVALPNARFSPNHAIPILMDNVHCTGRETRLVNCSYDSYTSEDFHYEDASVQCFGENGKYSHRNSNYMPAIIVKHAEALN